jgi:hypothetical protein
MLVVYGYKILDKLEVNLVMLILAWLQFSITIIITIFYIIQTAPVDIKQAKKAILEEEQNRRVEKTSL